MLKSVFADPRKYVKESMTHDLLAGVTVAIMLIPQGMAYALLAGLPPIYGLYTALTPLLIYPFIGSSIYLSVGPTALISITVLTGLSSIAEPMSGEFIQLAFLTALVAGFIQLLLSIFRMGFLVNLLSHPVISGFTSAAALIIAFSQLKHLFGLDIPTATSFLDSVSSIFVNLGNYNQHAVILGVAAILLIFALKRLNKSIPTALIVVTLGILIVMLTPWKNANIPIVGQIPSGLPSFAMPQITIDNIIKVLPVSLIVCLISFIESLAIAKTLASKNDQYGLDANKELMGLGMAKMVSSFFLSFPSTGSFSRSAINEQAGAKSGMASIIAGLFIGLTLLFFTGVFHFLPKAILAAIVIAAVFGLIDIKSAVKLFKTHKRDFLVLLTTFVLTLLLGIQNGVLVGVALSILFILHKVSQPHYAVLGRIDNLDRYRNVDRYEEAQEYENLLIIRYDDDIFFGNAEHFFNNVLNEVEKRPLIKDLVLNLNPVGQIDSTGIHQFELLVATIESKGINVHLCSIKGPVRDELKTYRFDEHIQSDNVHWDVRDAVENILKANEVKSKTS